MRFIVQLLLGISSGLPLLAIGSTLKAWLTESGISIETIGFLSIIGLPYTLKFLWAPVFDYCPLPFLGRRKGWLIILQIILAALFCLFSIFDPKTDLTSMSVLAFIIAFVSASQDILADALRRDVLEDRDLGLGNGFFVNGYRVGMLLSGALALNLAEIFSWDKIYIFIAACFVFGLLGTIFAKENEQDRTAKISSFREAVLGPFQDFFNKDLAWTLLAFVLLYKLGDAMASEMTTPFFLKLGYSKGAIGTIAKTFGLASIMCGALIGGLFIQRLGFSKSLWIFGFLQAASITGFALLAVLPATITNLAAAVAFENFSSGMGTSAYCAFMASLCNRKFSATQYALLSSVMGIPRVIFGASTGVLVQHLSWPGFFLLCSALALPGMLLLKKIAPWDKPPSQT